MRPGRITWSIVGLLSICAAARAGPVTWQFAGQVTSVRDLDGLFAGTVEVGSPFSGSYTFESTTPDSYPELPSLGLYRGAITDIRGQVGLVEFEIRPLHDNGISVGNNSLSDGSDSYAATGSVTLLGRWAGFGIVLRDVQGNVFTTDELGVLAPDLGEFELAAFSVSDPLERFGINGVVTQLIPEPVTITLLVVGGLLLGWRRASARHRGQNGAATPHVGCVVSAALLATASYVQTVDCNNNGVEDACDLNCGAPGCVSPCGIWVDCNGNGIPDKCEIDVNSTALGGPFFCTSNCAPDCNDTGVLDECERSCRADVVFLIDTSGSVFEDDITLICNKIDAAVASLASRILRHEILLYGSEGTQACRCCTDTVRNRYCPPARPDPANHCTWFGDGCEFGDTEDSAPATAVVAANKLWASGARVIVPIVDEGPRCGYPVNDPGDDRDAVNQTGPILDANDVCAAPVVVRDTPAEGGVNQPNPDVIELMDVLTDFPVLGVSDLNQFRRARCADHFVFIMPRRDTIDRRLWHHGMVRGADPTGLEWSYRGAHADGRTVCVSRPHGGSNPLLTEQRYSAYLPSTNDRG